MLMVACMQFMFGETSLALVNFDNHVMSMINGYRFTDIVSTVATVCQQLQCMMNAAARLI